MPLVKINLRAGRTNEDKDAIAAAIHAALVENVGIPDADRYQLFTEYSPDNFRHTSSYLGLSYTDQLLIIEITFLVGRDDTTKKALLAAIDRNLVAAGVVGADDVFVMLTEIGLANLSFGQGLAQRAPAL
ncbi:MAG: 4-oxalocrotonate tautomerase YusQ [Nocardioidaceae bacterium]|nr:4-oxalocrotonate tautomerase YusQ [Nocardioidaceae bacterium]